MSTTEQADHTAQRFRNYGDASIYAAKHKLGGSYLLTLVEAGPGKTAYALAPKLQQAAASTDIVVRSLRPDLRTHVFPAFEYSWGKYTPLRATTALIAEGKVGKSTLSLMQQIHGAAGLPFLNQPTREGLHVYLSCEDDFEIVERRAQKIMSTFTPEQYAKAMANFKIIDGVGKGYQFITFDQNQVQISGVIDRIADAVIAVANGRAIVDVAVDTVSRVNGGQENDNNVMAMVEAGGARLSQRLKCAVKLLHHTSKAAAREGIEDHLTGRGGAAFGDNCRSVLRLMPLTWTMVTTAKLEGLDRTEVERGDVLKLVHAALNQDRKADPIYLRRTNEGLLEVITPTTRNEAQAADIEMQELVEWFKRGNGTPFTVTYAGRRARAQWTKMTETAAVAFVNSAVYEKRLLKKGATKGHDTYVPAPEMLARINNSIVHQAPQAFEQPTPPAPDWLDTPLTHPERSLNS